METYYQSQIEKYEISAKLEKATIEKIQEQFMSGEIDSVEGCFKTAYSRLGKALYMKQLYEEELQGWLANYPSLQKKTVDSSSSPLKLVALTQPSSSITNNTDSKKWRSGRWSDDEGDDISDLPPIEWRDEKDLPTVPSTIEVKINKGAVSEFSEECLSEIDSKSNISSDSDSEEIVKLKKRYSCVNCKLSFRKKYNLQRHIDNEICSSQRQQPSAIGYSRKASISKTKVFSCDICLKTFDTQFFLNTHSLSHTLTDEYYTNETSSIQVGRVSINNMARDYLIKPRYKVVDYVQWLYSNETLIQELFNNFDHYLVKAMMYLNVKFLKINEINGAISEEILSIPSGAADIVGSVDLWLPQHIERLQLYFNKHNMLGSDLVFDSVETVKLKITLLENYVGGSKFALPQSLKNKKAVINIKAKARCFKYAVLSILHYDDVEDNRDRLSKYKNWEDELKFDGIQDLENMSFRSIKKFEENNKIKINVHAWDDGLKGVIYNSKNSHDKVVNLLLIYDKYTERKHYCGIVSLNRLYFGDNKHCGNVWRCDRCIRKFYVKKNFLTHYEWCRRGKLQIESTPKETKLGYKVSGDTLSPLQVIYADIECYIENNVHKPAAISCFQVWHEKYSDRNQLHLWEGEKCIHQFLNFLDKTAHSQFNNDHLSRKNIQMTNEDNQRYLLAKTCDYCHVPFDDIHKKVKDHCHITGEYRNALCCKCNFRIRLKRRHIPVIFHNFKSYDSHMIIKHGLGFMKKWELHAITQSKEKFMCITARICVGINQNNKKMYFDVKFLDSLQFMNASLAALVENLDELQYIQYLKKDYPNLTNEIIRRKGVFPYSYFNSPQVLNETSLPSIHHFKNDLRGEECSESEYEHAQTAWTQFQCETFGDYMKAYLKLDVLLLVDVFEKFREVTLSEDELDPTHFVSLPSMSYKSAFKMTKEEIDLLDDLEMYNVFERGIRGGLTFVNKHLVKEEISEKEHIHLKYIDENNLYGSALSKYLPHSNFTWVDDLDKLSKPEYIMSLPDDGEWGYLFELDLIYPDDVKYKTADFPLAPESGEVTEDLFSNFMKEYHHELQGEKVYKPTRKLLLTQFNKNDYVVHFSILKFYLKMGLMIKQVHRIIKFRQKPFLKAYIDYNSNKRQHAKNSFEKDFYKLKNNSLFGKTMEDVRKRVNYKLVNDVKKLKKLARTPLFYDRDNISDDIIGVKMLKSKVVLDKPIFIGQAVLDHAKLEMYKLYYEVLTPCPLVNNIQLVGGDTDSFFLRISINREIHINQVFQYLEPYFDSSNYPLDHPLYSIGNKAKLGCFKDECAGREIEEMILLRPKMYSLKYKNEDVSIKRAKGISKSLVRKMKHKEYKLSFMNKLVTKVKMTILKSKSHTVETKTFEKHGLSSWEDKRCWISSNISLPHGHPDTGIPQPKRIKLSIPPSGDVI